MFSQRISNFGAQHTFRGTSRWRALLQAVLVIIGLLGVCTRPNEETKPFRCRKTFQGTACCSGHHIWTWLLLAHSYKYSQPKTVYYLSCDPILRLHVCYSGSNWCFTVTDIQGAWVALTILTQIFFQTKLSFSKILYIPITLKTVLYLHQIFSSLPSVLPSWPVPTASQYYQNFSALFEQHKTHSPTSWYNPPSIPKLSLSLLLLIRNPFPTIHGQRIYT